MVTAGATVEEQLAHLASWEPKLPPNKIEIETAPDLDIVSPEKANQVVVTPNTLRFKAADHPDVASWEPGRVVVSEPGAKGSPGKNLFGFARKVERVEQVGDELVVITQPAQLHEILHGDFQVEIDPSAGREIEWEEFGEQAEWIAANLYTNTTINLDNMPQGLRYNGAAAAQPVDGGGDPFCCKFISDAVGGVVDKVGSGVKAAANVVKNTGKSVGSAIKDGAVTAAGVVVSGAKTAAGAVVTGAKAAGGAVATGAKAVGSAAATVGSAVATGAKAVARKIGSTVKTLEDGLQDAMAAVADLVDAIMPASFGGTATLDPEFSFEAFDLNLVSHKFVKDINKAGEYPMRASLGVDSNVRGTLEFKPVLSIGGEVPNPLKRGDKPPMRVWLDVSAMASAILEFDLLLEAELVSVGGEAGSKLEEMLNTASDIAGPILNSFRESLLGQEDTAPAGGWKKTLFLSKPKSTVILLGKLPVVLTATFQVDVECGFELKAKLDANATVTSTHTFNFRAEYIAGRGITKSKPEYKHVPSLVVSVLGAGEASVACGIIPRINVFLYDTIGLNAGIRASMSLNAEYESTCAPESVWPEGEVEISLKAGVGVPVGARIQVPGSSYGGKEALDAGADFGPLEVWNHEWTLLEKSWDVPGLGYCTPTCSNGKKNEGEKETDVDCGGECATGCDSGKQCKVNTDCKSGLYCSGGVCGDDHCSDGVRSGDEVNVDCGGSKCGKCPPDLPCASAADCETGSCKKGTLFLGIESPVGVCTADACTNGQKDDGECATDCGGKCGPCPTGALCADSAQCASGISNGFQCTDLCTNLTRDANESDVDCGGGSSCARCTQGRRCGADTDCASSAPLCQNGVCTAAPTSCGAFGEACCAGDACAAGLSCHGLCQCPSDKGIFCGGTCCNAGQMCNNDQCVDPAPSCIEFPTEVRGTCEAGNCPTSCKDILARNPSQQSGVYMIQPHGAVSPFPVRCDMSLDGGGWTLVGFEPAGHPQGKADGAMAMLFAESGSAEAVATGAGPGFIGPRFKFAQGHYRELRMNWCDPQQNQNLYQRFTTTEELFTDSERAKNGTIQLTGFQSNDAVLNQQIPTPDSARFCRARTSDKRPGDTSWGIKGANEQNFDCGCNSGSWRGVGSYYGGTGTGCTSCLCQGGGWAGTAGEGVPKGGITRNSVYVWVR